MKLEKIDRIKITESNDENDTGYFNRVNKHLFTKIQNYCPDREIEIRVVNPTEKIQC